ncbi:MAG: hypothetical protein J6Q85_02440 [Clostridia bacterium]|nr:hypothetical protein [Clostridia bacterium]
MITKVSKTLDKKRFFTVISASVLALLIISYSILSLILSAGLSDGGEDEEPLPDIIEGVEDIYAGYAIAYPYIKEADIQSVNVKYYDEDGVARLYSAARETDKGSFIFYYTDSNGQAAEYRPTITEESGFDYSSLYGSDSVNGLNIPRLTYLMLAVGVMYFDDKIEMPEDSEERQKMLSRYGLTEDKRQSISVKYIENNTQKEHIIHIGDITVDRTGYYYTVDDRSCIYKSRATSFNYALGGFISLLHSRLVAQGLAVDKTFEPYLTTDLKQWKNTLYDDEGDLIVDGSTVIFYGSSSLPVYDEELSEYPGGYFVGQKNKITLELDKISSKNGHINTALSGLPIKSGHELTLIELLGTSWVDTGSEYSYEITEIEGVFDSDGAPYSAYDGYSVGSLIDTEGTPVADFRYVVVTYDYSVKHEGETKSYKNAHAVLDLENGDTGAFGAVIPEIKASAVGTLSSPITLNVIYNESTQSKCKFEYVVLDINVIYEKDSEGNLKQVSKIGESSEVAVRYAIKVNGETVSVDNGKLSLSEIKEGDGMQYAIKQALIGKTAVTGANLVAYEENLPVEYFMDFVMYEIDSLEYFVSHEIIASLEFVNASERDPFYGESLFKNTLENKYRIYALDATNAEAVVRVLGGINNDSSSTTSEGLVGTETVAVGLTPDNMRKYGLYANTVYFELPRGIETVSNGSNIDDYRFLDRLGFTLYISDLQPDGTRYVGSDMYDIIAIVDEGKKFDFLDKTFVEYWARETLAAVSYTEINEMTFDVYMSDVYGSYEFKINHEQKWLDADGKIVNQPPVEDSEPFDFVTVFAMIKSPLSVTTGSLLKSSSDLKVKEGEMYADDYLGYIRMCKLYARAMGLDGIPGIKTDTYGTSNFKSVLDVIFYTSYTGRVSEKEQAEAADLDVLMRISFKVNNSDSLNRYVYEFRRLDDRRVMVTLCKENRDGVRRNEVSDFYVSTFAFKKIVRSFTEFINGQTVDGDIGYVS